MRPTNFRACLNGRHGGGGAITIDYRGASGPGGDKDNVNFDDIGEVGVVLSELEFDDTTPAVIREF